MTPPDPDRLEVRPITLDAGGTPLSGLLAGEATAPPRAVVVALHGGGMSAGYFDSRARPGLSLLELGARLGYRVLALDRPGYGASARHHPEGLGLEEQADLVRRALAGFAPGTGRGAGFFLVAHSSGGRLALRLAGDDDPRVPLIGVDVSGLGSRFAVGPEELPGRDGRGAWRRHWGALRHYPPNALLTSGALVRPVPEREAREQLRWPAMYPAVAARVRVPVRFTFAEREQWWRHDERAVAELLAALTAAPRAEAVRQPDAGHNISLGWAARTYHLRVLAFLEECLLARDAAPSGPPRNPPAPVPAAG
ncbi:alpha/beta fold hydrolase [Streptomyces sp. CSDS2]|uniref:alpha/beta hydrolase n=1 Tax=Streptomyces sp. CSDS2 TaxID=3055051 RepID=UPI0025AEF519|nr:alpha/beta fold hydrolase [Streptomyces sp. CSDS2]MDN3265704.1 alpha/beta fold hydrolase [Streptomyces sp. CSDS2]